MISSEIYAGKRLVIVQLAFSVANLNRNIITDNWLQVMN